jgi:hypothetical protein
MHSIEAEAEHSLADLVKIGNGQLQCSRSRDPHLTVELHSIRLVGTIDVPGGSNLLKTRPSVSTCESRSISPVHISAVQQSCQADPWL